jgi:hypothetical protein
MTKQLTRNYVLFSISVGLLIPCVVLSKEPAATGKHQNNNVTKLRVEVTAGEEPEAVSGAEVFVQPADEDHPDGRSLRTDKKGVVTFLKVPRGNVLIQVTADGYERFGSRYDLDEESKTIAVTLSKRNDGGR